MPTVYQASCANCDYRSSVFPAEYGAVWVDDAPPEPQALLAGMVNISDGPVELASEAEPNLVVLAHPAESSILASTGHSWRSLLRQGRYVASKTVLCAGCGELYPRRRLAAPAAVGCLPGLIIGAVVAALVYHVRGKVAAAIAAAWVATFVSIMAASALAALYIRVRFRERDRKLRSRAGCPRCSSTTFHTIPTSNVAPCPKCKAVALSVREVGMS